MIVSQENFAEVIAAKLGGTLHDIEPIGKGMEHRMFRAQWENANVLMPITIRFFTGPRAFDQARNEAQALGELCSDAYPVPDVYTLISDAATPDAPFTVMQYIEGESLTRVAFAQRDKLQFWLDRASDLLLKLHGIRWENGYEWLKPVLSHLGYAERMLNWWGAQADALPDDADVLRGFDWLRAHLFIARTGKQQSLVHRDFTSDNLLVEGSRIVAVLDWTDLRIADPAVDVAWTRLILATEFRADLAELFVKGYTRRNNAVAPTLPFWEVFSAVKRIIQIDAVKAGECERLGIWSDAPDLTRMLEAEVNVREFLAARLTTDEDM